MELSPNRVTCESAVIYDELNEIRSLDRISCIALWRKVHKKQPPPHLSLHFMRKALMFEAQVSKYGGLSKPARSMFKRTLNAGDKRSIACRKPTTALRQGTHLVREWNGKTYRVEVMENSFRMNTREFASLSAIAKHITGAHWSGPRFFGLGGAA